MTKATPTPRRKRRTQAERSDAMRRRLLQATLDCLRSEGYAGTTVTKIVERAGVSRGAHVHHYPSKQALLVDAAEQLMRDGYKRIGEAMLQQPAGKDRLPLLIMDWWRNLFGTPANQIYMELLIGSRQDPVLAEALGRLSRGAVEVMELAARHFFESDDPAVDDILAPFLLNQWLLRGMAMDLVLVDDPARLERYVELWGKLLASHIKLREHIDTPPPRPSHWDTHVVDQMDAPAPPAAGDRKDQAGGRRKRTPRSS